MDCIVAARFTHIRKESLGMRGIDSWSIVQNGPLALRCYQPKSSFFTKILVDSNAFGGSAALYNARAFVGYWRIWLYNTRIGALCTLGKEKDR
jgi:hypothetical protein